MIRRLKALTSALLPFASTQYTPINSSQRFLAMSAASANTETATFAAGCFWGVEHIFLKHYPIAENKGILKTRVGYTGGHQTDEIPDYRQVCTGRTGHAEALQIVFDPSIVKYDELVGASQPSLYERLTTDNFRSEFFYRTHDPTTLNSQGADRGTRTFMSCVCQMHGCLTFLRVLTEYRSAIFTHSPEQEDVAKRVTSQVQKAHFDPIGSKIVTEIKPATKWFDAEDYHQEYLFKNPSGYQCPTHRLHW
jgi:peptide-methionine (S)-S-oxide reductase